MSDKVLVRLNWGLKLLIAGCGVLMVILYFVPGSGFEKIWSYLATIPLAFAVDIVRCFGLKPSRKLELEYYLFLIPAMIIGIDLDAYKMGVWFDKIVHGLSGVLAMLVAQEILAGGKIRGNKWVKLLFLISFVALSAVIWECFEFFYDQLLGGSMQELVQHGVADTMWDMTAAMIGGVVAILISALSAPWDEQKAR